MKLYPKGFYTQIEFDKIRDLLCQYALNSETRQRLLELEPSCDYDRILTSLMRTDEYVKIREAQESFSISLFESVHESLERLSIEGYVLALEEIIEIGNQLSMGVQLRQWLTNKRRKEYPCLSLVLEGLPDLKMLYNHYTRIIDEHGEVRPNASPELAKVSRNIQQQEHRVNNSFDKVVARYQQSNSLADSPESYRNGRRVLSVKAEYKRQIKGIIHGESGGGRVVYIEPQEIVTLNNELNELYDERRREIYKILKELCGDLGDHTSDLRIQYNTLRDLDEIRAKGELAIVLDAVRPNIVDKPKLKILELRHPLLYLKNKETDQPVVPLTVHLHGRNKILLISGPNAGGKSITLKGIGLSQVMIQAGLLIPAHENSEYGIFDFFFSDIGDQQSIDESLSTYSSRLAVMKDMLDLATERSLLLIDEFGSGTDPILGAALAESILRAFHKKSIWAVITTHYSNLKVFAFRTKGIVNAGMMFDKENLNPTYQLSIGKPGSSYTFEIAQKMGITKHVIHYAKQKAGKNASEIERMLNNLNADQQRLKETQQRLDQKERQLQQLINTYENLKKDLDQKRRQFKLEKKEAQFNYEEQLKQELDKINRELKRVQKKKSQPSQNNNAEDDSANQIVERARELTKQKKAKILEDITSLEETISKQDPHAQVVELEEGGYAKIRRSGVVGKVVEIEGDKVRLESGFIQIEVRKGDVIPVAEQIDTKQKSAYRQLSTVPVASEFSTSLDIRGVQMSDARDMVQRFLDQALLVNAHQVKIIHGLGKGALRKMVANILRDYKDIKSASHPPREEGGEGVTIVRI